jgi:hypothetical protein
LVILYIYSTCWHMKSTFYEHQQKRDRYKRNIEDTIEEKMNTMFEAKFRSYMENLSQGK